MQINTVGNNPLVQGFSANTDYEAARASAEAKNFQNTLANATARLANSGSEANNKNVINNPLTYENKVKPDTQEKRNKDLMEACQGFESMFLSMMYKQMRATVPENKLFGTSNAIRIFEDMRDTELMNGIAKAGGIGIAEMMYKQLSPQINKK